MVEDCLSSPREPVCGRTLSARWRGSSDGPLDAKLPERLRTGGPLGVPCYGNMVEDNEVLLK